jgi:hypothetical protein
MLIDRRCRLRTVVAVHACEIESGHPVLAEGAFERRVAIHRFGCVISHICGPHGCSCQMVRRDAAHVGSVASRDFWDFDQRITVVADDDLSHIMIRNPVVII